MHSGVQRSLIVLVLVAGTAWGAAVPCDLGSAGPEVASKEWQPRTPEQTLYAYVRCLNDSSASIDMKIRWVRWQPDASAESQCYVKCVSEELRLYDSERHQFNPERFIKQAEAFSYADQEELQKLRVNAESMLSGALPDSSCETVFMKYGPFYVTHMNTILRMFHGDYRDLPKTYQTLGPHVKQIGQTFINYCVSENDGSTNIWSEDSDHSGCPSTALVDCIFRGFRWITEEGRVNANEIVRDYRAAGFDDESDLCGSIQSGTGELYRCLRDKDHEKLAKVIRERDQRTAFYFDASSQEEPWKSAVEFATNLV
ncbi:37 kDa salivary gland allergen Aed a 2-like [Uranotaenia lowii]|uniref:37 kDa salivary gland allergen Aed a 2-like n=1 Tax=Uranotaenia lowii TaxID=190385 RepID=UPI0024793472|nr:37 kDa salivary gland allergen Aed a 2-like [Uranotaenia lowii]